MKYINEYSGYEKNLFSKVNSKPEVILTNLIKDLEIKHHKDYPESTFFIHKDTGEVWMEDDKKNGYLWISYEKIWSKIHLSFPHKSLNAIELIKYVLGLVFKIDVESFRWAWGNKLVARWEMISNE